MCKMQRRAVLVVGVGQGNLEPLRLVHQAYEKKLGKLLQVLMLARRGLGLAIGGNCTRCFRRPN